MFGELGQGIQFMIMSSSFFICSDIILRLCRLIGMFFYICKWDAATCMAMYGFGLSIARLWVVYDRDYVWGLSYLALVAELAAGAMHLVTMYFINICFV